MSNPPARTDYPAAWPAALALALFAAVGAAVLDDYGVGIDADQQRAVGQAAVDYVLGDTDAAWTDDVRWYNRYYGVAFEAPLILAERLLGLTDSRAVFLSRHLLTHLFFLTGGWFCYLLTWRLFGDRWLALFALLLFLLHPRIYAQSFYNSKDLPFLTMFMITLYLMQRAFRRDTVAAFALCGVGVGVLVNLRIMGLALFAAVPALRALDLAQARATAQRRRALATAAAFVVAAAGTLYALSPYLWRDPFAIVDAVTTLSRHPILVGTLFQGELVRWPFHPAHYLPTWMAITTPPATLLLGLVGVAAVIHRGSAAPRRAAGNTELRFALLLTACLVLPMVAVAALRPNLYDGWRHLYFLYAPLCLLAVYGLRWLLAAAPRRGRLRRGMIYLLAAAALAGMAAAGLRLHPHQQGYFNFLVDRRTPERLRTRYDMLYWGVEYRQGLEYLLARFPEATLHVEHGVSGTLLRNRLILPAEARRRIVVTGERGPAPDFFFERMLRDIPFGPIVYARRIYHNTLLAITALDLSRIDQATVDRYRATYRAAVAGEPLLRLRSQFDLYLDGRALTWVKEPCRPEDTVPWFVLRTVPAAVDDLPAWEREAGKGVLDFHFARYGVRFDGRCLLRRNLPDYPLRAFEVGHPAAGDGDVIEAAIDLRGAQPAVRHWPDNPYWQAHAAITAGERGAPAARAPFDLYLDAAGATLTYHKQPCAGADLEVRFFLHLFPVDVADLPADHRPHGFHNRSFRWREHGAALGSVCVALAPLPAWERGIAHVRTGQFDLWITEFPAGEATGE